MVSFEILSKYIWLVSEQFEGNFNFIWVWAYFFGPYSRVSNIDFNTNISDQY